MKHSWDNLLVRFSVVSFVVLFAIAAAITLVLSGNIRSQAMDEAVRHVTHYSGMVLSLLTPADLEAPMAGERYARFHESVQRSILSDVFIKVKVWSKDGTLIYSSEPAEGLDEPRAHSGMLPAALRGETVANVEDDEVPDRAGEPRSAKFLEVYSPIVFPGTPEPQGAFAFYQSFEPTAQHISSMRTWTFSAVGIGFLALYGALVTVVWGGSRTISRQQVLLTTANADLRTLIETIPHGIEEIDRSGIITLSNVAHHKMHGYAEGEMLGRAAWDMLQDDAERENLRARLETFLRDEPPPTAYLGRDRTKDGRVIDVQVDWDYKRDELGRVSGIVSVVTDITERKQLQEQLMQAQKMEVVGQLAGGVAHDFNNLLTPIMGYAGMLMAALPPGDPARQHLQDILHAAERGASVTRQLLTFSRRQIIQTEIIDLNDLMFSVDRMLRRLIGEDIELVSRRAPEVSTARVDPGQMEQVLVNMAVNARGAMPRGGKLTIETANVTLDEASARQFADLAPGRYVRLSVADTGVGMAEEVRSRVFEPFFTTKGVGEGTGLGLSICYGIVKQSHGEILVRSEPGKGATFEIYLPWVDEACAEAVESSEQDELLKGSEAVLVVEDEPSVRRLTADVLSRQGYTVLEATTGEEALRVARDYRSGEIDLLLTDVVMPQMGGRDLADRLGSRFPEMKVVFTSGYSGEIVMRHGVSDTDRSFLPKPFTLEMVARKVREALDAPQQGQ